MSWCHQNGTHTGHIYTNGFGHRELCSGGAGPEDEEPEDPEEVSEADLEWMRKNWTPGEGTFRTWVAGSDRAHRIVSGMLADREVIAKARGPGYVESKG